MASAMLDITIAFGFSNVLSPLFYYTILYNAVSISSSASVCLFTKQMQKRIIT